MTGACFSLSPQTRACLKVFYVETQRRVPCSHPAPAWSWRGLGLPSFDKCGPVKIRLGGRLGLRRRRCVSSLDWVTWEPFRAGCESGGNCTAGIVQWGRGGGPRRKWGRLPPLQLFPSNFPAAPVGARPKLGAPVFPQGHCATSASPPPSLCWGRTALGAGVVTQARRLTAPGRSSGRSLPDRPAIISFFSKSGDRLDVGQVAEMQMFGALAATRN